MKRIIDSLYPLSLVDTNSDIRGDDFEYFLKAYLANQNKDLGEYFTPRHIVKALIKLVNPKFGETVYDPFCGTGGFLTAAFNYIKENNIIKNDEDLSRLKHNTLYGRELTTTARIAKMNMVLHGDGHSGIQQLDSLRNPINNQYNVIVTNMPFSQKITTKYHISLILHITMPLQKIAVMPLVFYIA